MLTVEKKKKRALVVANLINNWFKGTFLCIYLSGSCTTVTVTDSIWTDFSFYLMCSICKIFTVCLVFSLDSTDDSHKDRPVYMAYHTVIY